MKLDKILEGNVVDINKKLNQRTQNAKAQVLQHLNREIATSIVELSRTIGAEQADETIIKYLEDTAAGLAYEIDRNKHDL